MSSCHLQWQVKSMGALTSCVSFLISFFLKSLVACRLCVIYVREDVYSNVFRLWLHGLYGLYGPRCPLPPPPPPPPQKKKKVKLNHSLLKCWTKNGSIHMVMIMVVVDWDPTFSARISHTHTFLLTRHGVSRGGDIWPCHRGKLYITLWYFKALWFELPISLRICNVLSISCLPPLVGIYIEQAVWWFLCSPLPLLLWWIFGNLRLFLLDGSDADVLAAKWALRESWMRSRPVEVELFLLAEIQSRCFNLINSLHIYVFFNYDFLDMYISGTCVYPWEHFWVWKWTLIKHAIETFSLCE